MNLQPNIPVTEVSARKTRLDALIQADTEALANLISDLNLPAANDLRPAQSGLIMLQGRMGGGGAPFNLGEATIARASVSLPTGEEGHGYVLGRDTTKARMIAHLDAAAQCDQWTAQIDEFANLQRIATQATQTRKAEETAATKVQFFTMTRGED